MTDSKFRIFWTLPESDSSGFDYFKAGEIYFQSDPNQEFDELEQFVGVSDKNGKDYFIGDKGRFDNGDTFVLKMEDNCLQVYVDWIGDPECEDQARDLYRISKAEIVGNIHEGE